MEPVVVKKKQTSYGVMLGDQEIEGGTMDSIGEGRNKVGFEASRTVNTGNYESTRLQVWVEIACDNVDDGFKYAVTFVNDKLCEVLEEVYQQMDEKKDNK